MNHISSQMGLHWLPENSVKSLSASRVIWQQMDDLRVPTEHEEAVFNYVAPQRWNKCKKCVFVYEMCSHINKLALIPLCVPWWVRYDTCLIYMCVLLRVSSTAWSSWALRKMEILIHLSEYLSNFSCTYKVYILFKCAFMLKFLLCVCVQQYCSGFIISGSFYQHSRRLQSNICKLFFFLFFSFPLLFPF